MVPASATRGARAEKSNLEVAASETRETWLSMGTLLISSSSAPLSKAIEGLKKTLSPLPKESEKPLEKPVVKFSSARMGVLT